MAKAQVLYDFEAQPGTSELSVYAGETLAITRQDIGEGWWEGRNERGEVGLFPAAYVQELHEPPPGPPPPLPAEYSGNNETWNDPWSQSAQNPKPTPALQSVASQDAEDWDDDWDDDSETGAHAPQPPSHKISVSSADDPVGGRPAGSGTVRRTFNRFTGFVKTGGEDYLLGGGTDNDDHVRWEPLEETMTCMVTEPQKASKLKGFKSFIQYNITPNTTRTPVTRRYKHFDWLHLRLEEKFTFIPISPLPDKSVTGESLGRYETEFIEHRRVRLESWVGRVCRHPVLARSQVWRHFISCHDERDWKAGKRRAEKDEFLGARQFLAIEAPDTALKPEFVDTKMENFARVVPVLEKAATGLSVKSIEQIKRLERFYNRDYSTIGAAFSSLGSAIDFDRCLALEEREEKLKNALRFTGNVYDNIGQLCEAQPKYDWEPVADKMHEYRGMLAAYPDVLQLHKACF
ncbi:unnamed protein product [Notodromas monacha]|uniref:Sorting nexin n=1 Tax=Notodromas monacha TaxID=399045 RepID=A0A7R9BU75_9CRUS|nr:unnamed protein product [Notodromas monacha]CAG0921834.1 unnamed protein product [Notodromas monacha]